MNAVEVGTLVGLGLLASAITVVVGYELGYKSGFDDGSEE